MINMDLVEIGKNRVQNDCFRYDEKPPFHRDKEGGI
jgi:hypothetical protein